MTARRITAVTAAAGAVLAATVAATASAASAAPSSTAVANTRPTWTAHARHLGHAKSSAPVSARVYLAPRGGLAALKAAAIAVSTPGGATYRRFLSKSAYQQRYGVTAATVEAVSAFLRANGLHVRSVGAANRYISVTGKVAAAEKTFGTKIERFRHDNATVQAPTSALKVPTSLASSVLTITGIDTTKRVMKPASTPQHAPAGFRVGKPCSAYYGQKSATSVPKFAGKTLPYAVCGYTGRQLRTAYEGSTKLTGAGVTVAITDAFAAPTIRGDANTYAARHGDKPFADGQFVQTKAPFYEQQEACQPSGWYGEETLDVEAVHAMAPNAKVHYYAASNCYDDGLLVALGNVVDDDSARVVTNSWGDPENDKTDGAGEWAAAYEAVFAQGALEGISFLYSSGDDGDELAASGTLQPIYPSSDPLVTSVGGTSTAIDAHSKLVWQTVWGTHKFSLTDAGTWNPQGFAYGGGGGASTVFAKPTYQDGVVPGDMRQTPDMALNGDPTTGMLVGETQEFPDGTYYDEYRIGGTSLASPLFAGMTALSVQHAGSGAGLLNPVIYSAHSAFTDIKGKGPDVGNVRPDYVNGVDASDGVGYSVRTFNQDSSLQTRKGWDDGTGVGVPNPGWLTALG